MRVKIVKGITILAMILVLVSIFALDSESDVPAIVCFISYVWLGLFVIANRERGGGDD